MRKHINIDFAYWEPVLVARTADQGSAVPAPHYLSISRRSFQRLGNPQLDQSLPRLREMLAAGELSASAASA